ncbi:MAG: ATP:cob(I)alamin adenosyltransferase [Spirochaetaceae bacterium]|jgi:ATP:cob(I)alamin adenosyltransferase|nr:ATP:cob(I)alamin adenosyltransferase [Spirochaetaceae bacterium]
MSITTKKGDDGFTGLPGAEGRVRKDDLRIECLGALDELNAFLAEARAALLRSQTARQKSPAARIIEALQKELAEALGAFVSGGLLPNSDGKKTKSARDSRQEEKTASFPAAAQCEDWIAKLEKKQPVQGFIQTWTNPGAIKLNISRTVCRRAERCTAGLGIADPGYLPLVTWLNRLSDLLFLLAAAEERNIHLDA